MTYVDGFVCPVKPGRKDDYVKMAEMAAPLFIEYGALRVVETWNEELMVGKTNDFRTAVIAGKARMSSSRGSSGPTRKRASPGGRS